MARRATICLAALAALASAGTAAAMLHGSGAGWREIAWPYATDAWPAGRAFACGGRACGGEMVVTIRPKIGFCNCATGVSGDAEVDAVADLDMITDDFVPKAAGEPIEVAGMAGLMRRYQLRLPDGETRPAAGYALSSHCDLVVAASQGPGATTDHARAAVAALLTSPPVAVWINRLLGRSNDGSK